MKRGQNKHTTVAIAVDVRVTLAENIKPHEFIAMLRTFLNEGNARVAQYIGDNRATVALKHKISSTRYERPVNA